MRAILRAATEPMLKRNNGLRSSGWHVCHVPRLPAARGESFKL